MNQIEKLIEELCPNGVEYKPLGEVAHYVKEKVDASVLTADNFVGVENLLQNKRGKIKTTRGPNTSKVTAYKIGDILLGNIRPYLKKIWLSSNSGGCSGDVLAIRISDSSSKSLMPEFLFYVLSSDKFFNFNNSHATGGKMPRGNKKKILDYRVPQPPFRVQQEIVRILDTFQSLEAELEAELEARRKQYEFYRDQLLTFTEREREESGE
ncbi:hypothetical protein HMPREF2752_07325 [Corynebacterium sp. HMSC077C02]|uniref:restriction endonuclease subunit S n=1 Tax=Corynebacterium sp. HMSC077C02 TaxID=1739256 RepID=UPI0008B9A84D|nr:restriction endonuclease subunit S [Corynebacterium sp. HMSC077C02]OFL74279.1 hypothetical protein HMPREF2752_07325 [Corynebacterium sp. HMSC077C02]